MDKIAPELRVVARSEDGLPEALESNNEWGVMAVQWHPELMAHSDENAFQISKQWTAQL